MSGFTTKIGERRGTGLHWCANSVNAMGGKLFARSPGLNQGATLHLILPLGRCRGHVRRLSERHAAPDAPVSRPKKRILLADDEPRILDEYAQILSGNEAKDAQRIALGRTGARALRRRRLRRR